MPLYAGKFPPILIGLYVDALYTAGLFIPNAGGKIAGFTIWLVIIGWIGCVGNILCKLGTCPTTGCIGVIGWIVCGTAGGITGAITDLTGKVETDNGNGGLTPIIDLVPVWIGTADGFWIICGLGTTGLIGIIGLAGIWGFTAIVLANGLGIIGIVGEGKGTDTGFGTVLIVLVAIGTGEGTTDFWAYITGFGIIEDATGIGTIGAGGGTIDFCAYGKGLETVTEVVIGAGGGTIDFCPYKAGLGIVNADGGGSWVGTGGGTIDFWV